MIFISLRVPTLKYIYFILIIFAINNYVDFILFVITIWKLFSLSTNCLIMAFAGRNSILNMSYQN